MISTEVHRAILAVNAVFCLLFCCARLNAPAFAQAAQPEHDILYSDAKWCGPRIVYFFSCLLGDDPTSLEEVVKICESDRDGTTSLLDLVRAAKELGLSPVPMRCTSEELVRFGGPAIVCLKLPGESGDGGSAPVHFAGVLRPPGNGPLLLVDPSRRASAFPIRDEGLRRSFTGTVVFLGGAAPGRGTASAWGVIAAVSAFFAVIVAVRARRRMPTTSTELGA